MCKRTVALNQKIIREKTAEVTDHTYDRLVCILGDGANCMDNGGRQAFGNCGKLCDLVGGGQARCAGLTTHGDCTGVTPFRMRDIATELKENLKSP